MDELVEPVITDNNRGFWEGCASGELRAQSCLDCSHLRYPSAPWCPACLSDRWQWRALSGRGTVHAKLVFHQSYHPAWKDRIPYNVVLVQLEEGPRMISNVVPLATQDFSVGDSVEVAFDPEGEFFLPRFRLVT